jgi:hypothetical protein
MDILPGIAAHMDPFHLYTYKFKEEMVTKSITPPILKQSSGYLYDTEHLRDFHKLEKVIEMLIEKIEARYALSSDSRRVATGNLWNQVDEIWDDLKTRKITSIKPYILKTDEI